MTVVPDTNTWISALQFGLRRDGTPSTPLRAILKAASFDSIVTCAEIRDEVLEVLVRKFRWEDAKARSTLGQWLESTRDVTISGEIQACRDPDDDVFLECAVKGRADIVITGDDDLLVLDPFQGIRILTPRDYLSI